MVKDVAEFVRARREEKIPMMTNIQAKAREVANLVLDQQGFSDKIHGAFWIQYQTTNSCARNTQVTSFRDNTIHLLPRNEPCLHILI